MQTITFLEFQSFSDGTVITDDKTKKTIREGEYAQEDTMNALSAFYMKCGGAAISKCDIDTVKAVDYKGDVWQGCELTFRHPQKTQE